MKKLIVFVMIVGMGIAHAQQERTLKLNKEKKLIELPIIMIMVISVKLVITL
jgi:hypothetical protein